MSPWQGLSGFNNTHAYDDINIAAIAFPGPGHATELVPKIF
jgi:hypothetical protein